LRFTLHLKSFPKPVELLRQQFVGKPAPALSGMQRGPEESPSAHSLGLSKDQLGKPIVLVFWRPDCRECPVTLPHVNHWYSQYKGRLTVIGIAVVEPGEVAGEAKKLGIQYPTFADPHGTTTLAYSATLVPTLFLIDAAGIVRGVLIGSEPAELSRMQSAIKAMVER
jgi:thiol-disulfide isomerase/thioredoxin